MEILDFNSIITKTSERPTRRALLMGNGFSQSISNKFNYSSLLALTKNQNIMDTDVLPKGVEHLFNDLDTDDFEKVIAYIDITQKVLTSYSKSSRFKNTLVQLNEDKARIKNSFIKAINYMHHNLNTEMEDRYPKISSFLKHFSYVFTLNYDLTLYWSILEHNKIVDSRCKFYDGFFPSGWGTYSDKNKVQNVFYLHGSLFIDGLYKLTKPPGSTITAELIARIQNETFSPLLVLAGKHEVKTQQIKQTPYLQYCITKLSNIDQTDLIIIGSSLNEHSDNHIYEQIRMGKYRSISFGLHNYRDSDPIAAKLVERVNRLRKGSNQIYFFRAESAITWDKLE